MENNSTQLGKEGEGVAKEHLETHGYKIIASNWRHRKLEIDLVALIRDTLVFVEVKARKNNDFGNPEFFVDRKKQKHLVEAANAYIEQNNLDLEARFDIIGINHQKHEITHIEGAFYPMAE